MQSVTVREEGNARVLREPGIGHQVRVILASHGLWAHAPGFSPIVPRAPALGVPRAPTTPASHASGAMTSSARTWHTALLAEVSQGQLIGACPCNALLRR